MSLILFSIAVIAYGVKELQAHSKLKWMKGDASFWGEQSWKRKYKLPLRPPSTNFKDIAAYYKLIKSPYREAFPGSTTIFVTFTDAPHMLQFLFKIFLISSLVTYKEMVSPVVDGFIYFSIWQLVFNVVYKFLSR